MSDLTGFLNTMQVSMLNNQFKCYRDVKNMFINKSKKERGERCKKFHYIGT